MIEILGLGVMGSAAAWSLARRGAKVVGRERFAPVVGEILADLATAGSTRHPIGLFRPDRFT